MTRGPVRVSHVGPRVRCVSRATGRGYHSSDGRPDSSQWGPGENLPREPAVRRVATSLGSRAQDENPAIRCRTTRSGLPVALAMVPRALFGETTELEPPPGAAADGCPSFRGPQGLSASLVRRAVPGSLPKTCGSEGFSCRFSATRFSVQQGAVVRRRVASRLPLAPALSCLKKLDVPSSERKKTGPFFQRLRGALAGGVRGPRTEQAFPFHIACASLGAARVPRQLVSPPLLGLPAPPPLLSTRLSSNAFCGQSGGHVKYDKERNPDLGPISQWWPLLVFGAQYP